jgi:plastocyanin domain-containing protein
MNKILYIISAIILGTIIIFVSIRSETPTVEGQNVSIINGQQIIEITAKGGYSPKKTTAQANLPTILKIQTNGTFDCSSALNIPTLNFSKILPQNGVTEIPIPLNKTTGKFRGLCSMGMYNFEIDFL